MIYIAWLMCEEWPARHFLWTDSTTGDSPILTHLILTARRFLQYFKQTFILSLVGSCVANRKPFTQPGTATTAQPQKASLLRNQWIDAAVNPIKWHHAKRNIWVASHLQTQIILFTNFKGRELLVGGQYTVLCLNQLDIFLFKENF